MKTDTQSSSEHKEQEIVLKKQEATKVRFETTEEIQEIKEVRKASDDKLVGTFGINKNTPFDFYQGNHFTESQKNLQESV